MLPLWLSSWYQHPQVQSQEPFNDQYEAVDEDGGWVEVITPSTKRRQPQQHKAPENNNNNETKTTPTTVTSTTESVTTAAEPVLKGLSRQERRAKARFTIKEKKKQARNVTMAINRNRKAATGGSSCLPSSSVTIEC